MIDVFRKCFNINLNDYENININLEINKVIIGAFVALIIGIVLLSLFRANVRLAVVQLIRHGADCEENAKTLSELGLDKSKGVRRLLTKKNTLTGIVARVGEIKPEYDEYVAMSKEEREDIEKFDVDCARFYIRESEKDRALNVKDRYVVSTARIVVSCVFFGLICVCIIACMPGILNLVDRFLKSIKM